MEGTNVDLDLTTAVWRKATRSGNGGNCVEVAAVTGTKDGAQQPMIALRDSKHPNGPVIGFTHSEFHAFIGGTRDGDFDDLLT